MTIKVSELAKKLGRTSKEVVSKAKELGIVAKAANSSLSQADAQSGKSGKKDAFG